MQRLRTIVLFLLLAVSCGGREEPRGPALNVLLISLDSTRQDLLSGYGGRARYAPEPPISPNLDRLAEQGVLFEDAYATSSWTLPSHVSLLTGEPELVHGVDLDAHRLAASIPTLAEILERHGYRTAGFYSGPYLGASFGFARGFERYEACYGPQLTLAAKGELAATARIAEAAADPGSATVLPELMAKGAAEQALEQASHRDVSADYVTDAAIGEIESASAGERPFFVFAHYFDPHYDYIPPEPWDERFDPDYRGSVDGQDFYTNPAVSVVDPSSPSGRRRVIGERDLEHVRALYAGELAWTDEQIGRLLERLDDLGLTERTLVVVVADHGDEFFEHGGIGHRRTLFEEVVRVPLILRLRERLPAGRRVRGPVALTAVLPTILDMLGLHEPDHPDSQSLLSVIEPGVSERGVLGRIVRTDPLFIRVPTDAGLTVPVSGQLITVLETYREGPIKVTRERRWTVRTEDAPPEVVRAIEEQSRRMHAEEELRWIDLSLHPGERPEDHSSDFDDTRARAALRAFHDRYAALMRRRRVGPLATPAANVLALLAGLGYVGQDARVGALAGEELELEPPGEAVLDAGD